MQTRHEFFHIQLRDITERWNLLSSTLKKSQLLALRKPKGHMELLKVRAEYHAQHTLLITSAAGGGSMQCEQQWAFPDPYQYHTPLNALIVKMHIYCPTIKGQKNL